MTYTPITVIQTLIDTSVPITTLGDTLYGDASGDPARLGGNTVASRKFYTQVGDGVASDVPSWYTLTKTDVGLSNVENTALSTWVGTANITTLGTITTGTWSATAVGPTKGGTGISTYTLGDLLYSSASNTLAKLSGNISTTKNFLAQTGDSVNSAAPVWTTVTKSDVGLGSVENTALSTWTGSTNVTALGTISTGTWSATAIGVTKGGTGLTSCALGDVFYGNGTNSIGKLTGTTSLARNFLRQVGDGLVSDAPAWDTVTKSDVGLGNVEDVAINTWAGSTNVTTLGTISTGTWSASTISTTKGGTGLTGYALGDTVYASATNTLAKLSGNTTTTRNFLRQTGDGVASAAPVWDTVTKADVGLGSVENTALSTWAGTTNVTTLGTVSTGTWSATTVATTKGGTGLTSYTLGDTVYCSAANTLAKLSGNTTTTKKFLRQTGDGVDSAAPAWDTVTATDVGLGSVENTALSTWAGTTNITTLGTVSTGTWSASSIAATKGGTGIATYTLGDTLYSSASNTLAKLAGNTTTTKKFLSQTGDGAASAAPSWSTVSSTDVGLGSVENTALSTWAGTTNITTLGTISTGTWSGTAVGITKGGTGQTTAYAAHDALTVAGADIASAGTTDIAGGTGIYITITGTTTITALGTAAAGVVRILKFSGILTLTHNATSLILPTGANITTAAGDVATMVSLGSGNWRCIAYTRADGTALSSSVADGSITLAKLANLAQDKFIGRVTASTGVPETATITAAARTVLDDTSVSDMLTTLAGGVSPTGSAGYPGSNSLVFQNYPTLYNTYTTDATFYSSSPGQLFYQFVVGNKMYGMYTSTAGDAATEEYYAQRVTTTNNTVTTLHTITIPANKTVLLCATVLARRTGGSAGTAQDAASYIIAGTFNITSGTAAQIGTTTVIHSAESQAGWDATFDVTGATARIRVTGATNNNITWHSHVKYYVLGS